MRVHMEIALAQKNQSLTRLIKRVSQEQSAKNEGRLTESVLRNKALSPYRKSILFREFWRKQARSLS